MNDFIPDNRRGAAASTGTKRRAGIHNTRMLFVRTRFHVKDCFFISLKTKGIPAWRETHDKNKKGYKPDADFHIKNFTKCIKLLFTFANEVRNNRDYDEYSADQFCRLQGDGQYYRGLEP